MRQECYDNAARALESKENQILPTFGGRPWQVTCRITEKDNNKKSPLFRWFRGELELAVLPHLLEKVPDPKESQGMAKLEEEQEEGFFHATTDLCERAPSQLSRMAWTDGDHAIPGVTLKWLSPNHQWFYSRKSAEEHAQLLVEQQLMVDKVCFGYGSRGQKLRPTKPTKKDALTAGKWRFLRDGLWVVGQEESWQAERVKDVMRETKEREEEAQRQREEEQRKKEEAAKLEEENPKVCAKLAAKKPRKPSRLSAPIKRPIQLFLRTQRVLYREDMLRKLAGIEHGVTPAHFTLPDADRDLKEIWRNMSNEEKQLWKDLMDGLSKPRNGSSPVDESQSMGDTPSEQKSADTAAHSKGGKVKANMDGLKLYIRDHRDHLRRQRVGQMAQAQQAGDTTLAAERYTMDQADEELTNIWTELDSATRKEWEEKACREALSESVVITPGESEEEVEESVAVASEPEQVTSIALIEQKSQNENQQLHIGETDQKESESGTNTRRSKRARTKKNLDMPEDPTPRRKKPRRKPNIWAFPVSQTPTPISDEKQEEKAPAVTTNTPTIGEINASTTICDVMEIPHGDSTMNTAINMSEEQKPAVNVIMSKTDDNLEWRLSAVGKPLENKKATPKRKRASCPPKQISQSAHWRLSAEQIRLCHEAATDHFEKVMYTVQARALFAELADGFDLLRERGRGRYDMELPVFEEEEFSFLTDLQKAPWMPVVRQMLGEEVGLIHKGVFLSNPGADAQLYHQDGPHLSTQHQRPCHAVNVFVPLVDLNHRNGPTEFVAGSHILGYDDYDRSKVVTPAVAAGTPIIFDYRLGHRGLANTSNVCRPIVYCTYAAIADGKAFRDSVNFSRKRYHRLGDIAEKPLSRDERRKIRDLAKEDRKCIEAVEQIEAATDFVNIAAAKLPATGSQDE